MATNKLATAKPEMGRYSWVSVVVVDMSVVLETRLASERQVGEEIPRCERSVPPIQFTLLQSRRPPKRHASNRVCQGVGGMSSVGLRRLRAQRGDRFRLVARAAAAYPYFECDSRAAGGIAMLGGYDRPLYVLPFDHRGSFQAKMFGWKGALTPEQTAEIAATKRVIYDAFEEALAGGVPKEKAGILVDEQFGSAILADAVAKGYSVSCPAEKSGQDEFDFEYGEQFAEHIERVNPTFCKVLVRYNPGGDKALNLRQAARLKRLADYLHSHDHLFMFELLVPAEKHQLATVDGDLRRYDREVRPALMVQAIHELQDAGVEADVWKIEGLDDKADCERVVAAARRNGRDKVGCIVLGRGEDDKKVRDWLAVAAAVPGFIGFAVGRTTFWDPCVDFRSGTISRAEAVRRIAARFREWVEVFEKSR
jgi:5-dehydro-2-deoxygluconokinase